MKKIRWYVSPFLVVMVAVLTICGYFYDCVIYFVTIILHELAHAEMSLRLGYTLDSFRLMPYGAALKGEFEGVMPIDEIMIAAVGPLFNCAVAVIFTALWWVAPVTYVFTERLVYANLFTAIFNLLPVFPLDGGRIALGSLSKFMPRSKAYKRVRIFGFIAAPIFAGLFFVLIFFNGTINFSFALISVFIFVSTVVPDKNSVYRRIYSVAFLSERLNKGLKVVTVMIPDDMTLVKMDRMLSGSCYTVFFVVDDKMKKIGEISETQLEEMLKKHTPLSKIGQIIQSARR